MVEANFRLLLGEHPQALAVSAGVQALLGYTQQDLLTGGIRLEDRIHPDDADIAGLLFSASDWPAATDFNIRLRHADGRIRCLRGQCTTQAGPRGKVLHLTLQDAKSLQRAADARLLSTHLRALMEINDGFVYFKDRHHVFTATNQRAREALLELANLQSDVVGLTDYDLFPESYADAFYRLEKEVFAGRPIAQAVQNSIDKDGKEVRIDNRKFPVRNDRGDIVGLVGIARPLLDPLQMAESLRESKELFQLFVQHVPAALAMFDRDMRYVAVSRRWLESYGLAGQSIIGRSHYEVFPNLPDSWKQAHRQALAGETVRANEDILHTPDGRTLWIRRELRPWLTGTGAIGGIIIFSEDVTRQKHAEERLHLAANVFTHASEGILITDAAGRILDVNEAFTRITGYTRDEVLGRNPRLLQSGRYSSEFYADMWRQLIDSGSWSGEIWNRAKSGRIFAENLTINAVPDENGKPRQFVALFSDITSLKEQERKLEHVTHYDLLTGLPNRTLLADRLHQAMAHTHRHGRIMAVASLDLDDFKVINDRHGHNVGDRLLTALTRRMSHALREGDTLARLGGDEFAAVLLDLTSPDEAISLLMPLLRSAAEPVQVGELMLQVSASLGVTYFPQSDDVDADQLLRQASQAMYHAKLEGKSRYHIFDPRLDRTLRGHHEDLGRIRQALHAGEFELHFQPRVNMATGAVLGAEALLRWHHPERGLIQPTQFLPVTENDPLAIEIGEWVIQSVLAQIERWSTEGFNLPISVNVAAQHLQRPDFPDRLRQILAEHPGVAPASIELEVLESSALQDIAQVSEVIRACRRLGVTFALDDFGTGYSSLSYLKRLPVDVLKIDQSFVHDMLDDPEDLAILEGVLGLATAFRRQAVAEGVETVDHGLMLLRLGCQIAQGYGVARPMPAQELPGWAALWRPHPQWVNVAPAAVDDWPLLHAGVEHRAWVASVEDFLRELRHGYPALDHLSCKFGGWLQTESQTQRGMLSAFGRIDTLHQQMHTFAAELVALHTQGQQAAALSGLPQLHALRDALNEKLNSLQSHYNQGVPR